jgi:1,5-anhydro-D-fructose reductase (1,5-anhydro-D-mannitol-forming)
MSLPLRFGVIGIGNIVKGTIAPAMVAEPDIELVAGVSRDQERADAFAEEFGARFAYTRFEEMLANPEVDAVFIATPNDQHADQVIAAALAGKHVLCDKPLSTNVPDAIAAVEACARAGVKLGINFHNRHLPWVRDTREIIGAGMIGEVEVIQVEAGSGPRIYDNWRTNPEQAGLGSLYNVGVHVLDFLGWILESLPVVVTALVDNVPGSASVETLAMALLRFENGALAYVNCNERILYPQNTISIHGKGGRIVGVDLTRSRMDGTLYVKTPAGEAAASYPSPGAHRLCIAAFTAAVLNGEEPNASGIDGLRSMELCEAIARAVTERRTVTVEYSAILPGTA